MAWVFSCRSFMCESVWQTVVPEKSLVDAIHNFRNEKTDGCALNRDTEIIAMHEVPLDDAKKMGRRLGKQLRGFEWANETKGGATMKKSIFIGQGGCEATRRSFLAGRAEGLEEAAKACHDSIQSQGPYFATLIRSLIKK